MGKKRDNNKCFVLKSNADNKQYDFKFVNFLDQEKATTNVHKKHDCKVESLCEVERFFCSMMRCISETVGRIY